MGTHTSQVAASRQIGVAGTTARLVAGVILVGVVVIGHWNNFWLPPWILGLIGFPAVTIAWQAIRARYVPERLQATGPVVHLVNIGVFLALYLTPLYAPALKVTSDAALLFYGSSMILAAVRGYAGCEVLAVSNWLLRRDDQIGCVVFGPIDSVESRRRRG